MTPDVIEEVIPQLKHWQTFVYTVSMAYSSPSSDGNVVDAQAVVRVWDRDGAWVKEVIVSECIKLHHH
jgi:hypothetical protein